MIPLVSRPSFKREIRYLARRFFGFSLRVLSVVSVVACTVLTLGFFGVVEIGQDDDQPDCDAQLGDVCESYLNGAYSTQVGPRIHRTQILWGLLYDKSEPGPNTEQQLDQQEPVLQQDCIPPASPTKLELPQRAPPKPLSTSLLVKDGLGECYVEIRLHAPMCVDIVDQQGTRFSLRKPAFLAEPMHGEIGPYYGQPFQLEFGAEMMGYLPCQPVEVDRVMKAPPTDESQDISPVDVLVFNIRICPTDKDNTGKLYTSRFLYYVFAYLAHAIVELERWHEEARGYSIRPS